MMRIAIVIMFVLAAAGSPALARKSPAAWSATRTVDPITGEKRCVVAALDHAGGLSWSRIGALYPVIETGSSDGLLVGVSSGGRVRIPTGDIVWRVDALPFRELKAADNPRPAAAVGSEATKDVAASAMENVMATARAMSISLSVFVDLAVGCGASDAQPVIAVILTMSQFP